MEGIVESNPFFLYTSMAGTKVLKRRKAAKAASKAASHQEPPKPPKPPPSA